MAKTKRWTCDVCKVAKFQSFDEACRHEEQCQKQRQHQQQQDEIEASRQNNDAENVDETDTRVGHHVAASEQETLLTSPSPGTALKSGKKRKSDEHERAARTTRANDDDDANVIMVVSSRSSSSENETEAASKETETTSHDGESEHVFHFFAPAAKPKRKKPRNEEPTTVKRAGRTSKEDARQRIEKLSDKPQAKKKSKQSPATNASVETFFSSSATRKSSRNTATTSDVIEIMDEAPLQQSSQSSRNKAKPAKQQTIEIIEEAPLRQSSSSSSRNKAKTAKKQTKKAANTNNKQGDKSTDSIVNALAVLGVSAEIDSEELLAQQRLAEFQASRLAQQQRERERRKRREENATTASKSQDNPVANFFAAPKKRQPKPKQKQQQTTQVGAAAGFFSGKDAKTLKSEHVTAEFQAKRRAQQEKERERRIKRDENAARHQSTTGELSLSTGYKKKPDQFAAPRFPNPSHVFPQNESLAPEHAETMDWKPTPIAPPLEQEKRTVAFTTHFPPPNSPWSAYADAAKDPICSIFERILSQSPIDRTLDCEAPCNALLADKYRLSAADIEREAIGEDTNLKYAATELRSFVEEWKIHRSKANQRMAERQRMLVQKKRLKKKGGKRKSQQELDDELWGDEDESDDSLRPLFVLSGPVSCGKSSLVYAVAEQCDCSVIEINTSEKRSGAALKQRLEEATLSHSSMDLLKKKRQQSLLASQLVDSDEEDSDSENEEGDNLALILIDEVDLLFETQGDNGFWSALGDISKRTKCPIVLTANEMPDQELRNHRFHHAELTAPCLDSVARRMRFILKQEGVGTVDDSLLKSLAILLRGDLRRFCNELQSYLEIGRPTATRDSNDMSVGTMAAKAAWEPLDMKLPVIDKIQPKSVLSKGRSVLTLTGKHFLSLASPELKREGRGYSVTAQCGEYPCLDACIMDDETAYVVTPPFQQKGLRAPPNDEIFDNDIEDSNREYYNVSLHATAKRGIVSTTAASFATQVMGDRTRMATTPNTCFLEVCFQETKSEKAVGSPAVQGSIEGNVAGWQSRNNNVEPLDLAERVVHDSSTLNEIEEMDRLARMASDAAVFEHEFGLGGTPYLAGSCKGFGFELTGESARHVNSKNPSESKLFEWGWKDDFYFHGDSESFVCDAVTTRERNLLKIALQGRGQNSTLVAENNVETFEEEEYRPSEHSEEDFLLPRPTAPSLLTLPDMLFSLSKSEHSRPHLEGDRTALYKNWVRFFDDIFFFVVNLQHQLFARGLSREINSVLHWSDCFDHRIVLDYVPMLRRMALHESAVDLLVKHKDTGNSRRRIGTRRGKKSGRDDNYFGVAFGDYFHRGSEEEIGDVTNKLCSSAMGWGLLAS